MLQKVKYPKRFSFYTEKEFFYRWDVLPFVLFIYPLALMISIREWDSEDQSIIKIVMFFTLTLHLVVFLGSYWSLEFKSRSVLTKVSPQRFNVQYVLVQSDKPFSKTELCPLIRSPNGVLQISYLQKLLTYDSKSNTFKSPLFPVNSPLQDYYTDLKLGYQPSEVTEKRQHFGQNTFQINVPEFWVLFKEHATSPFFVFQLFSVLILLLDDYVKTSTVTLIMLFVMESQLVSQRRKDLQAIQDMRPNDVYGAFILRGGKWERIPVSQIVPGDVMAVARDIADPEIEKKLTKKEKMLLGEGYALPCDLVLIQGSCVVNESSLTGESVPQRKESLPTDDMDLILDVKGKHKHSILHSGTRVIMHYSYDSTEGKESNYNSISALPTLPTPPIDCAIARVIRTGCHTTQGKILRTILTASERVTANSKEALIFLLVLLVGAIFSVSYIIFDHTRNPVHPSKFKLFLTCCHILMAIVPPDFAITLSCAVTLSLMKLVQKHIYCTEPFRIPNAGKVQICAFDKTGTLTKDKLERVGVFGLPALYDVCDKVKESSLQEKVTPNVVANPISHVRKYIERKNRQQQKGGETSEQIEAKEFEEEEIDEIQLDKREKKKEKTNPKNKQNLPFLTRCNLGLNHSLSHVNGQVVGDQMEVTAYEYAEQFHYLSPNNYISLPNVREIPQWKGALPDNGVCQALGDRFLIVKRYPFESSLRRSTVVIRHEGMGHDWMEYGNEKKDDFGQLLEKNKSEAPTVEMVRSWAKRSSTGYYVLTKGAFSSLVPFLSQDVSDQQKLCYALEARGYRVIALAARRLDGKGEKGETMSLSTLRQLGRAELEKNMEFSGFWVLECPVKLQTTNTIRKLNNASFHVCMITGDALRTACFVANDTQIAPKTKPWLQLTPPVADSEIRKAVEDRETGKDNNDSQVEVKDKKALKWTGVWDDSEKPFSLQISTLKTLAKSHSLCLSGECFDFLSFDETANLLPYIKVFARTSPQQKEKIIRLLSQKQKGILMCGDGTNDVGALKAATIGLSLLNLPSSMIAKKPTYTPLTEEQKKNMSPFVLQMHQKMQEKLGTDLDDGSMPVIQLGDASIASAFTYRGSSIQSVLHILRNGRAVQASIIQLYKITFLSSVISAISLSVLRLDGTKIGDTQGTIESMLTMTMMFSISKSPASDELTSELPPDSFFEWSSLLSVMLQGAIHSFCLLMSWWVARKKRGLDFDKDVDGDFTPNVVNTTVFYVRCAIQAGCFLSNYDGSPFLRSLRNNKSLLYSGVMLLGIVFLLVLEIMPDINQLVECTSLGEDGIQLFIFLLVLFDVVVSWGIAAFFRKFHRNKMQNPLM